ncbi:hypothetical protein Cni_G19638 [Canna indica]|uniref:Serine-threonine/tyrosine-protein kinase catalytic domain-containing protein n=1 Tax=Canna indica TaxID=4628 RepID=A0AAQ3KMH7_9LILI|nr:hypothetical protein Cni_G19638 [Canna indica]
MGNCWISGTSSIYRMSSNAKPESPKFQSHVMRDKEKEDSRLPSNPEEVEDLRRDTATNPLVAFTFNELKTITGNFRQDNVLGVGGFGRVYKGFITEDLREGFQQPLQVAVKVHDGDNSHQGHREWLEFFFLFRGHLTAMSDVYSFGIVLLELLTGRKSLDKSRPVREQMLADWAAPLLTHKKKVLGIIDPRLSADYPDKSVQKIAMLAHHCLNRNPKARPLMRDIVCSLEPLQLPIDLPSTMAINP